MTQRVEAIYEHGVLRPTKQLPFRNRARLTLIIQPADPVSRTRKLFRVSKRQAKVLIYDDTLLDA